MCTATVQDALKVTDRVQYATKYAHSACMRKLSDPEGRRHYL